MPDDEALAKAIRADLAPLAQELVELCYSKPSRHARQT